MLCLKETKAQLTTYLAAKTIDHSKAPTTKVSKPILWYMLTYRKGTLGDKPARPTSAYKVRRQACFSDTRLPCSNRIGHVWTVCMENQGMVLQTSMACDADILNAWNLYGTESNRKKNMTSLNGSSANYTSPKYTPKVNEFRWFLFFNRAAEGESVTAPTGSLTLHFQRAHCVVMILRKDGGSPPRIRSPVDCD